jgi:pre-rRNA-processing protein TSR3
LEQRSLERPRLTAGALESLNLDAMTSPDPHPGRDVLILRDPREGAHKCSLTPLRGMAGVRFVDWHRDLELDAGGRLLLDPGGDELGTSEAGRGVLLVDCSWRRVPSIQRALRGEVRRVRLPKLVTAYPRRSRTFEDPDQGLASVEALFALSCLSGRPDPELLAAYRWRDGFLAANPELAEALRGAAGDPGR